MQEPSAGRNRQAEGRQHQRVGPRGVARSLEEPRGVVEGGAATGLKKSGKRTQPSPPL